MPELTTCGASARTRVGCANLCSGINKRLCSDWWPGTKMDGVQTRQCSETEHLHKRPGEGLHYGEIGGKFGIRLYSQWCHPGHGQQV